MDIDAEPANDKHPVANREEVEDIINGDNRALFRPVIIQSAAVLEAVKARPGNVEVCLYGGATADLDSFCARRRPKSTVGAEESLRRGRTKESAKARKKAPQKSGLTVPRSYNPHSARGTRCPRHRSDSRDFVPWRFSDAGGRSAWMPSRRPKTCTLADISLRGHTTGSAVRSRLGWIVGMVQDRRIGLNVGWRQYWPLTWRAIRGSADIRGTRIDPQE